MTRLLNCHPDIRCLSEPFHPGNYEGKFHQLALSFSVDFALEMIWSKWNGIKHVWIPDGTPFKNHEEWNDRIGTGPDRKVILMRRRNLLRRAVSNLICAQTGYWIGTRDGFCDRLKNIELNPVEPETLRIQIDRDRGAMDRCIRSLEAANAQVRTICYEDFFREDQNRQDRLQTVNGILDFLGFSPVTEEKFVERWERHFDPGENRWATEEVYRKIPGVEAVEAAVGSDETGWLFRDGPFVRAG